MDIELRDPGRSFDPIQVRALGGSEDAKRSQGGWGIPLIRRYIDEIVYKREADENVLRLTKGLGRHGRDV